MAVCYRSLNELRQSPLSKKLMSPRAQWRSDDSWGHVTRMSRCRSWTRVTPENNSCSCLWLPPSHCLLGRIAVVQLRSCVWLFATPWTAARQASVLHYRREFAQTPVHWVSDDSLVSWGKWIQADENKMRERRLRTPRDEAREEIKEGVILTGGPGRTRVWAGLWQRRQTPSLGWGKGAQEPFATSFCGLSPQPHPSCSCISSISGRLTPVIHS